MPGYMELIASCGVLVAIGGVLLAARGQIGWSGGVGAGRPAGRPAIRVLGGLLIGCGLIVLVAQLGRGPAPESSQAGRAGRESAWREQPAAPPQGESAAKVYRNAYFGFRLPIPDGWEELDRGVIEEPGQQSQYGAQSEGQLLWLSRQATDDDAGLTLMLTAERLDSGASQEMTAERYLANVLRTIGEEPQSPRDVRRESPVTFAGMEFQRLSLSRPMEGGDLGTTYWTTIEQGHVLTFAGIYGSEAGRAEVEQLLRSIARDEAR